MTVSDRAETVADVQPDTPTAADTDLSTFATLLRLRHWARPHRRAVIVMVLTATGAMLAQSFVPLVIGAVVDGPIRHHDPSGLWSLSALALALGVAQAALFWCRRQAMADAALGVETDLRRDLFAHLQRLPVAFHDHWPSGQLMSRLTIDLSTLRRFVGFAAVFLIANTIASLVVLGLLIDLQPWLGLFVLVAMVPLLLQTRRFELRYSRDSRRVQDLTGDLATEVEESALGIRVIKSYGRRPHMLAGFGHNARRLQDAEITKMRTLGRFWALLEAQPLIVLAGATVGGTWCVAHGVFSLGDLVAFVALYLRLIWPIISLGWLLALAEESASAARRIFEVLDVQPDIADLPATVARTGSALAFEDVRFRYPGTDQDVLRGVDLDIRPGETMALVGAVGSGKTTLAALVPRLYDVTGGRVLVGGTDVRDLAVADLRHGVGVAFEEPTLFSATVFENLTMGRPGIDQGDVRDALAAVQADFVDDLPAGLETRIGEQGLSLSGGQRQRLALARAILGRPGLVVLDDPLSALDVHTEALVEAALRRMLAGTTALLVAHRPSTVLLADRVAMLADGRVAAVGTHRELLERVPAYRALLAQSSEMQDATP